MMIAMKKTLVLLLSASVLAGCSFYTTNVNDIRFESTRMDQRLEIPVGDVEVSADQLTYLGWVDAYVQKPSALEPDPTQEQVNFVLAHIGKQRGADAVIHVTYKEGISLSGRTRLEGRGQAIRIDSLHTENAVTPPAFNSISNNTVAPPASRQRLTDQLSARTAEPAATSATVPAATPSASRSNTPPPATSVVITTPDDNTQYRTSRRDKMSEQRERTELMLNNARFLEQKAQEHHDRDMHNATLRLIQQLESQRRFFAEQEENAR